MLCQSDAPITLVTGGCKAQARWVGPDGKVRCSLHQINEFGHAERLVRVEGYEPPEGAPAPGAGELAPLPDPLPGTHAALDALAAERGIDFGDATLVAEKQAILEATR